MDGTPPHSRDAETSFRRYNLVCGLVCGVALGGTALINLVVDPYRVYHDGWARLPYPKNERYLVPGLARNVRYPYDAITLGTSHSSNFQPAVMRRELGWETLRCSLDGCTMPEQLTVLHNALRTGRVKHVLWGVDFFALLTPWERLGESGKLPLYLYNRNWRTPFNYLLSSHTLSDSVQTALGRGERSLDERGSWFEKQANLFGDGKMLQVSPQWFDFVHRQRPAVLATWHDNMARIVATMREYPQVEFVCLLPPVSVMSMVIDFRDDGAYFAERKKFRETLFRTLLELPNARAYDFEQAFEVTHDFGLYKDPTHYGQETSDWMVREIAADRYRVTANNISTWQREWEQRVASFVRETARPDNPEYERLKLGRMHIHPPEPKQWAGAEPPPLR